MRPVPPRILSVAHSGPPPARPPYRFVFGLPADYGFAVAPGRHTPCLAGCVLTVDRSGLVEIVGPGREQVLAQAIRFLTPLARDRSPLAIPATLISPAPPFGLGGRDSYSIIVGAEVAVVATAVEPVLGASEENSQARKIPPSGEHLSSSRIGATEPDS